jgi:hypothetical protein
LDLRKTTSHRGEPQLGKFDKGKSLLQLIDRKKFDDLCEKWEMDKGVRSYLNLAADRNFGDVIFAAP